MTCSNILYIINIYYIYIFSSCLNLIVNFNNILYLTLSCRKHNSGYLFK